MIFTNTSSKHHRKLLDRCPSTRHPRISAAKIAPCHQNRTVSWQMSMPLSCRRSSTLRSDNGNRIYIITASRMISGEVLKYRKGLRFVMPSGYAAALPCSSHFVLTVPMGAQPMLALREPNRPSVAESSHAMACRYFRNAGSIFQLARPLLCFFLYNIMHHG